MNRQFDVFYTDYCPFIDTDNTIRITFSVIKALGSTHDQYRKGSFTCEHINECTFTHKAGCPVYDKATYD